MTEFLGFSGEEDEFLRRALLLANTPEVMGLEESEPHFSPRFERRMARLLADPFRAAKRILRPRWVKALNLAAMVALVVAVSFSLLMLNPTARAWFERVVEEWTGYSIDFTFFGTTSNDLGAWAPEYLPEGFELVENLKINGVRYVTYENSTGDSIEFTYLPTQQGSLLSVDQEHSYHETTMVGNRPANIFYGSTPGKPNYLTWTNQSDEILFLLVSTESPNEIIKIAKSVTETT